jgi:hypothetical protein
MIVSILFASPNIVAELLTVQINSKYGDWCDVKVTTETGIVRKENQHRIIRWRHRCNFIGF